MSRMWFLCIFQRLRMCQMWIVSTQKVFGNHSPDVRAEATASKDDDVWCSVGRSSAPGRGRDPAPRLQMRPGDRSTRHQHQGSLQGVRCQIKSGETVPSIWEWSRACRPVGRSSECDCECCEALYETAARAPLHFQVKFAPTSYSVCARSLVQCS